MSNINDLTFSDMAIKWNTNDYQININDAVSVDDYKDEAAIVDKRLSALEDQVLLIRRDVVLEKEYEELKEAWQAYNDLLAKLKTFKALKDSA